MTETALAFQEELFCSGLETVQDGFGKHLTWYTQKSDTTVVVAVGTGNFLNMQRQKNPYCVKDRLEPANGYLSF